MEAESRIQTRRLAARVIVVCGLLFVAWIGGAQAVAAQALEVSPQPIVVDATKDVSPPTATIYVTPSEAISPLELQSRDLDPDSGSDERTPKLKASQITFEPATRENLEADTEYRFIVSVADLKRAGAWRGKISLRWKTSSAEGGAGTRGERQVDLEVRYRTRPTLALSVPSKVVVHGTVGEDEVERFVVIQETAEGSGASGLEYSIEPLMTEDLEKMLPTGAVRVGAEPPTTVAGSKRTKVPIEIDLHGAKAGAYSGHLVVSSNAADLKIPMEIDVRRGMFLALVVLVSGVVLAWAIPWYRTKVQPKDEIRVRIGALQEGLAADEAFAASSGEAVRKRIATATLCLAKDDIAAAKVALDAAEAIWTHWRVNRPALLVLIAEISGLRSDITAEPRFAELPAIRALDAELDETLNQKIPDYVEAPSGLRDRIDDPVTGWRPTVQAGLDLFRLLRKLASETLPEPEEKNRKAIEDELRALPTASVKALQALLDRARALEPNTETVSGRIDLPAPSEHEVPGKPGTGRIGKMWEWVRRTGASAARWNLRFFRITTWLLAIGLLVVVGFNELYRGNPTFGADGLSDYLGLFLWGFGAEAGRAQVATLIKGWGVSSSIA